MMRKILLSAITAAFFGMCIYLQAESTEKAEATVKLRLQLVDADSGKNIPGMIRVFPFADDRPLPLPGLYDRLRGLKTPAAMAGWSVVPTSGVETSLPRGKLRLEAFSGLETALAVQEVDTTTTAAEEFVLRLKPAFRPENSDLVAGNTHLHLMNLTAADTEEYLKSIPAADRLKILFISYLERIKDDANYITNRYPIGNLEQFGATCVLVNNGEEHRHNFAPYGEGYGHIMFLNIKELIKPVSLGSGITGKGNDDRPLAPGIEEARKQGGTVIWCHNTSGYEALPHILAGKVDALNVFDGSRGGNYEGGYYLYLNIGLRFPISTGTDWFMYDFSRVYAKVSGSLTVPKWLDALKAGRCQATNSPLLSLTVDGKELGDVLNLDSAKLVHIEATATGRHDFQQLQLVRNGQVVRSEKSKQKGELFSARIDWDAFLDEPAWFAARIESMTRNELGGQLYAHTSPVYVDFQGKRLFDVEAGHLLLRRLEEAKEEISRRGKFGTDAARDRILTIYSEASQDLTKRIRQRSK